MKLSVGADEFSEIVKFTLEYLDLKGNTVEYYGPQEDGGAPWPKVAQQVGEDVVSGRSEEGILFCWTGTGVSIAANKVRGIRAALCVDAETARGARLWNDANVLCLSNRLTSAAIVEEILEKWFETHYIPNAEDDACLAMIQSLDEAPSIG